MEPKERARVEAHVAITRKIAEQLMAEAARLEEMLNDKPTPGQLAKKLLDFFCEQWKLKYREDYVVAGAKDMASLKRLVGSLTAREIATRMKLYLASTERFYVDARHGLSAFVGGINKFSTETAKDFSLATPAVGCKHKPRCASDAAHTSRTMREARAS